MSPFASLLLLSAEGGGGGLTDVDFTLTVSTMVLFGLFALVLGKFAWKPLLEIVAEREKTVREQVEGAEKAQAEAQALLAERRDVLKGAQREREEMIARAVQDAEAARSGLLGKARTEADQLVEKARRQIEQERTSAVAELRGQVADLAMAAAEKIVRSSLTPEVQRKLVDETIAALPRAQ